jgi:uncharacterized RDD family membrane protein YckC
MRRLRASPQCGPEPQKVLYVGLAQHWKGYRALSTLPSQVSSSPSWKQEVNRRVAAHKSRKGSAAAQPELFPEAHPSASSRAAAAAARVAARYAAAPSYSEILAGEARAALRAAETASWAALEAQAAAESVLAGLEAATAVKPAWELYTSPAVIEERQARQANHIAEPAYSDPLPAPQPTQSQSPESRAFEIRWEPDLPQRQAEPEPLRMTHEADFFDAEGWRQTAQPAQHMPAVEAIEVVEPAQTIHANLIEFPRELVATRKVRPRLAEGPLAAPQAQLSIFEVDPGDISTLPSEEVVVEASANSWTAPEWSDMELGAEPQREFAAETLEETLREPLPQAVEATALQLAPLNRRLMALVVNGALITGTFLAAAMAAAANVKDLPPLQEIERGSAVAVLVVGALYLAFFYLLAKGTPGMKYARISLSTFDGQNPTRAQRCGRLAALFLSLLPVGLGILWAIFDEDHLCWHDRLSRTYLRRS